MKKNRNIITYLIYIVLIFGFLLLFSSLLQTEEGTFYTELEFTTWDDVLYAPDELKDLTEDQRLAGHVGWDFSYYDKEFSRVRTNQLILNLEPGQTYGLYTERLTYAAKVWVDGNLLITMGTVSDSPDGFVPRTGSAVVYFTAKEETEIVIQRCNFCHAKWNIVNLYIGPQSIITRQVQNRFFKETAYLGFLFALGMFNLGLFAGMPERKRYLWFSISCFCNMIHQSVQDPKIIMLLFPDLNWYVSHKTEELSLCLLAVFLIFFMSDGIGRHIWPWADRVIVGFCLALTLFYLVSPSTFYSRYSLELEIGFAASVMLYCILLFVRVITIRNRLHKSQKYYLAGVAVFLVTGFMTLLRIGPSHVNMIRIGMILFEIIITLALAMEYRDVKLAYEESRRNEAQLRSMNEDMEQKQQMQENFMAIMNHEMRTPLTVIAGYADLSALQVSDGSTTEEEMVRNLELIKNEALRLGRIVEQSEKGVKSSVTWSSVERCSLYELLCDARDFCRPICDKRGTNIEVDCPEDVVISCMRDNMLQVMYNLILNAGRHAPKGYIKLHGSTGTDGVLIRVEDNGDGMDEETVARAFERGFTKDGRHGIGLALCREIVTRHNGKIWIEQNPDRGITVCISLPDKQ